MSSTPRLKPFPKQDRQQLLAKFLAALNQAPTLEHFRLAVRPGAERQLALLAALERGVIVGSPTLQPPACDDDVDALLCDILEFIDRDPQLKLHCSAYGTDRYLAILQTLGVWRHTAPLSQPTARELFATAFAHLSSDDDSSSSGLHPINSPASQVSAPNGELIAPAAADQAPAPGSSSPAQTMEGILVMATSPSDAETQQPCDSGGLIRHEGQMTGEQIPPGSLSADLVPARPIRRGRPAKLDDLAKGRLLGLMSYGLSFRQAAAQLGVHHQTLLNVMKRDEQFAQQVAEARLDAISQPLLTVVKASRNNWRAAAWLARFLEDRRSRIYEETPEERELKKLHRAS